MAGNTTGLLAACPRLLRGATVSLLVLLAGCQPAPVVSTPVPVPEPAVRASLSPSVGVLAQLCNGLRPVSEVGLVHNVEPDLGSAEDGATQGTPETAVLHGAEAARALDGVLRPDGAFCKDDQPRRRTACGRWHRDMNVTKAKSGWTCLVRRGCGEWGRDEEVCVGFIDGAWYARFVSERPGGELVGKRAAAMRRRVDQARREAALAAKKPSRGPRQ
jgi:hypothetical protein